jgi:acyl-ACP thioesterase
MSAELNFNTVVAYRDVDRNNLLGLPAVFKFLQEAAIKHADQFEAGTRAIVSRGESWMLNRIAVEIRRYPRYEEAVRIQTWSGGIRAFKGYRDFRVYCGEERVLSGSSLWLYVDLKTKSLIRVPDAVAHSFPSKPGQEFRPGLERIRLPAPAAEAAPVCRISVRHSDFDANGHVNNTTYFDMVQTALARAGLSTRPRAVEAQFLREIPPEVEWVDVRIEHRDSGSIFSISTAEGPCALGRVTWAETDSLQTALNSNAARCR